MTKQGIEIIGGVGYVPLGGKGGVGQYAQIDECDVDCVSRYNWRFTRDGYAQAHSGQRPDRHTLLLHHLILGRPTAGFVTDHISRDRLDNRRTNLRHVTYRVNSLNINPKHTNKLGVVGVHKLKSGHFSAEIREFGKRIYCGTFTTIAEASCVLSDRRDKIIAIEMGAGRG